MLKSPRSVVHADRLLVPVRAHPSGALRDRDTTVTLPGAHWAFGLFPVIAALIHPSIAFMLFSLAVSGLIAIKHKGNIERLRSGTESKMGQGRLG